VPYAARGSRRIHYEATGAGPLVVLVPGLGSGARLFGTLPRRFAKLSRSCVAYDPVGFPPSDVPAEPFTIEAAAHDLTALIAALGAGAADLVGTSLGGKIALAAAASAPDAVRSLCLLATSVSPSHRARRVYRYFELVAERMGEEEIGHAVAPFLFGRTLHGSRPALVDDIVRGLRPNAAIRALMAGQARALSAWDGAALAAGVTVPVLCIAGLEDTLTEAQEVRAAAALFPQARYEEIADAGHSLLLESGRAFDLVAAFLRDAAAQADARGAQ
jgi:pimeloyl-ACP methyl ester carboxylesterase